MELSDINVKQRGTVKSDVYENIEVKSEKQDETQKPGVTNKDEGLYEQLRIDNNHDKNDLQKKDDQPQRLKCVIYILSAMIIILYIAVIVLIIFVVVSRSPVDGTWTNWAEWTACDVACGNGTHIRTRACANPSPSFGGANCIGESSQNDICMKVMCPVTDGSWTNWGSWYACSVTCGAGTTARSRSCTNPKPSDYGEFCKGDPFQLQQCSLSNCSSTDGGWTNWGSWSACSVTCGGGGTKARGRSCTNPKPSDYGEHCDGDPFQFQQCSLSICSAKMSAFSVDRPSSYIGKLNFSHEIYQNGRDFSLSSGIYKCSIPGTYHFSVTLVKKRASTRVDRVYCYLFKSGQILIYISVDPTDDDTDKGNAAISQSVVIHLNNSDTVYLGSCNGQPSTYMENWSSFTGFLLYPDN